VSEKRLLACFAHPDDEAFPVGGVLAAQASRGVRVRLVTATLGEEGDIRQEGAATRDTLGDVRRVELACAVRALGLAEHALLDYRDSGMAGWESNNHPKAFVNADAGEVVERLVLEIRRFRPQVVLTFGPDGLYGHPDHIAISNHATEAFRLASDPTAFPHQMSGGVEPHQGERLFYSVRPQGFRREWAEALRGQGIDWPMPTPEQELQGVPEEELHLELDVSGEGDMEAKMACILCHRTQVAPDWPYHRVPRHVTARILGREFYVRAHPEVAESEKVGADFFEGLMTD
jgi:N-acetyl-1-D-myo-inositol-2-amino-2-deoxy-alpha-D-glucopyranoside deacetylase